MQIVFATNAFAQKPDFLLHHSYKDNYGMVGSLYKLKYRDVDSVVAFKELATWIDKAKSENEKEWVAVFQFLKLKYYTNGKQKNYPAFEAQIPSFIQETEEAGFDFVSNMALYSASLYYFNIVQKFSEAFNGYQTLYSKVAKKSLDEFPLKRLFLYEYGYAFYYFNDNDHAKKLFEEALTQPDNKNYGNSKWVNFQLCNILGLIFRRTNHLDSSNYYFIRARKIARDSTQLAVALGNVGYNYFLQKDYEKAIPLLEKEAIYSSVNKFDLASASSALIALAQINFDRKNIAHAKELCMQALSYLQQTPNREYDHLARGYGLLSQIHTNQNNFRLALAYADSAAIDKELNMQKMSATILLKATLDLKAEEFTNKIEMAESQRSKEVWMRNSIIIIMILLMIIALILFNRYRQKQKFELQSATEKLNAFTQSVFEKNKTIEGLQEELNIQRDDLVATINQYKILTETDWIKFRDLFDKVHIGYLQLLNERFPNLTAAEIRFLSLMKLNFTTTQMANALGVGATTIRSTKSRLRKKLGLNEEDSLEELVDRI